MIPYRKHNLVVFACHNLRPQKGKTMYLFLLPFGPASCSTLLFLPSQLVLLFLQELAQLLKSDEPIPYCRISYNDPC